jgi:hypothetical protein
VKVFLLRMLAVALLAGVGWLLAVFAPRVATGDDGQTVLDTTTTSTSGTSTSAAIAPAPIVVVIKPRYHGHDAQWWHDAYTAQHRRTRALKRTLLRQPTVTEALDLACTVYGGCATLWRRARCESHLDAGAVHHGQRNLLMAGHAAGLLQFLPSTWKTTPFARFSPFSPYANALAAGWMIGPAHRGSEWQCR